MQLRTGGIRLIQTHNYDKPLHGSSSMFLSILFSIGLISCKGIAVQTEHFLD